MMINIYCHIFIVHVTVDSFSCIKVGSENVKKISMFVEKNVTWGPADISGVPSDQKLDKAKELTYLSI